MTNQSPWRIMMVDDDEGYCKDAKEFLQGEPLTSAGDTALVKSVSDFSAALRILESRRYDAVILDVRQGDYEKEPEEDAGVQLLEAIKNARFLPIIFFTGLPNLVQHLANPPFIQVVRKGETLEPLLTAVQDTVRSQLPMINRALVSHVDRVQRDYMWHFVADNWSEIKAETDQEMIANLLARRLAASLTGPSVARLAQGLGGQAPASDEHVHPMGYYVMPPMTNPPYVAGDIHEGTIDGRPGYWIMLTPSCDLVQGKADRLLLAACDLLSEQQEFKNWEGNRSKPNTRRLTQLVSNRREKAQQDRYFYLPGAMMVPDLVVDLQNIVAVPQPEFESRALKRLASLDSPFTETLTSQFVRLFGRIGTPDLDTDKVIEHLAMRLNCVSSSSQTQQSP